MNTKILFATVVLLVNTTCIACNSNYSPNDLTKFKETKTCECCDLSGANLSGLHDYAHSNLKNAILNNSELRNTEINYSDFTDASMVGVKAYYGSSYYGFLDAIRSNFTNANLSESNLMYATFCYSDFTGASFNNANLSYADFTGAKVTIEQLEQASELCNTILPNGTRHSC